jgi:hypothetical protein
MKQIARPATAAEITEIVGPLDDAVLIRIEETEATPAEVLEAFTWATADDQIGTELEHRPRGVIARVYEILKREEPEPDERRWSNPASGNSGFIKLGKKLTRKKQQCEEIEYTVRSGGTPVYTEHYHFISCLQPDGTWKIA